MSDLDELFAEMEARKKAKAERMNKGPRVKRNYIDFREGEVNTIRMVQLPNQKPTVKYKRHFIGKIAWPGFKNSYMFNGVEKRNTFIASYEDNNPIEELRQTILRERSKHDFNSPEYKRLDMLAYSIKAKEVYEFVCIDRKDGNLKIAKVNTTFMDTIITLAKKPRYGSPWHEENGWDFEAENLGKGSYRITPCDVTPLTEAEKTAIKEMGYDLESWKAEATPETYKRRGISFNPNENPVSTVESTTKEKLSSTLEPLTDSLDDMPFDLEDSPF